MASKLKIKVNGLVHSVTASLDTPLLYVLHNELHLHGPRAVPAPCCWTARRFGRV